MVELDLADEVPGEDRNLLSFFRVKEKAISDLPGLERRHQACRMLA